MKDLSVTSRTRCASECSGRTPNPGLEGYPALRAGFVKTYLLAPVIAVLCGISQASAAITVTVTNANDSGAGSLRQALAAVPAGGTIDFAVGLSGQTIPLASELVLSKGVTIDASGLGGGLSLSGGGATRLFRVIVGGNLTLRSLTLTGGNGTGAAGSGFGGAIHNAGTTTVERCTLSGNSASNYGGGIHNALAGTLTITDSTFTGNSVSLYGGAISNSSVLTLVNSTLSANISGYEGGGIYNDFYGTLTVTNSTFTGNSAVYYGGAIFNGSPLSLNSATLAGNSADRIGGGVYNDFFGTLTFNNSIIAGNAAPASANVFGTWAGAFNLTSGDPQLSPLGHWGGPTQTMPPLPGSPVTDAGGTTALVTDQRGMARVLGGGLDLGAFESAISNYTASGLTIYARVPIADSAGEFEISTDPDFLPFVSTLAGTGTSGFADDSRLSAKFGYPSGVARDAFGYFFIADTGNNRIRMLGPDGVVSTIAGSGDYGLANGPGFAAAFAFPSAVAVGPDNNVYVADTYNHRICKLTRPASTGDTWTVTTVAGTGIAGFLDGAGAVAKFNYPYGMTVDGSGNIYVADAYNHRIRKVTPNGSVTTYAGSGTAGSLDSPTATSARLNTPESVVLAGGSLFVADTGNHRIREITAAGAVSTFAGSSAGFADATGTAAKFKTPSGLATDGSGSIYVTDEQNHRIRKITLAGEVTTVAGTGVPALLNGSSMVARFNAPTGVAVGLDKNLIVADAENQVLRRIVVKPISVVSSVVVGSANPSGIQVSAVLDVVALGLDPGVTYYFRWKSSTTGATQPLGQSFFLYDFPVVATNPATNLVPTSARLNATVDPQGGPTKVLLEYSTDPSLLHPFEVTTLAGFGGKPSGIVVDAGGDLVVADRLNHRIRRITSAGVVTPFAGSGVAGFANGTGTAAQFENPTGIAIDHHGDFYVADSSNHRIRKITGAGVVTTFAGSGVAGFADGAAAVAKFLYPAGVAVDADNNVYVADAGNHRIRKIDAITGLVTTLAGTGAAGFADGAYLTAQFSSPQALAVGPTGKVLVADTGNQRIRLIDAVGVLTLAGDGSEGFLDGPGSNARFSAPSGIVVDADGIAYVTDSGNHRIRRVGADGQVSTLAGSGIPGQENSPVVGLYPATACQFEFPAGIAVDGAGGLLVTQEGLVRKLARSATLPSARVTPDANGTGARSVFADVTQPLMPGATYYFRAKGISFRGSAVGDIFSFVAPQAAISVFAGIDTSAPPVVHQQPGSVDFGGTPKGQSVTRYFTIANPGGWPLTVNAIGVPAGYQLTGGTGVIPSLGSLTFQVTLAATAGGTFGGDISITSDAPGQAVFSFPVTGIVFDPPAVTTLAASAVGPGTATLNATVNPLGSNTTVWFEWSQDPDFNGVMVSTVAGSAALFNQPSGLATDAGGNIYVADTLNHRIRKIAPDGTASTFAGTGVAGFADGPAAVAQFNQPMGLAMSASGVLFVSDSQNHRIRAINAAGDVATYSGLGTAGFTDGIAAAARFNSPAGLASDGGGALYVADSQNHRIRRVATDGSVSTVAGTGVAGSGNGAGTVAKFNTPVGVALDSTGLIYVTEAASHAIRKIAPDGFTSVYAGSAGAAGWVDASGAAARFANPVGLAVGPGNVLYVADKGNHRIRTVKPGGIVVTVAGAGGAGTIDGFGDVAKFSSPVALAVTAAGRVIVGDSGSSAIRTIDSLQVLQQAATDLTGTADLPVQLPVTGLPAAGSYFFRAIATNSGGTTIGGTLTNATLTFRDWQVTKFGADADKPLIAGPAASPAGDGVSNLLKYAFGLEPRVAVTGGLPVVELVGGSLTLTYTKMLAATDLRYNAEWSSDLVHWNQTNITEQLVSGVGLSQRIRALVPAAPATAKFLRLRIILQ